MIVETNDSGSLFDFLTGHSSSKSSRRRATRYGAQGNSVEADLAGSATPRRSARRIDRDEEFGDLGSSMCQQRQLLAPEIQRGLMNGLGLRLSGRGCGVLLAFDFMLGAESRVLAQQTTIAGGEP